MKKLFVIVFTALMASGWAGGSYAAKSSCGGDVNEMYRQIQQYGSITSHDGHRFTEVLDVTSEDHFKCSAKGYIGHGKSSEYICKISWDQGDWGDTFRCKY